MKNTESVATSNASKKDVTSLSRSTSQTLILRHGIITPGWLISRLISREIHVDIAYQRRYHKWANHKFSSYVKGMFYGFSLKDQMIILDIDYALGEEKNLSNPDEHFVGYLSDLLDRGYKYVLIDGQHRAQSLKEYVEGRVLKFPKGTKTIFELDGIPHDLDKVFLLYGDVLKEYFLEQPISVTMVLRASLPALKELFVTSNEGTKLSTIEKGMAGNAPFVVDGIGKICSSSTYDAIWEKVKSVSINKRQHEELIAKLLKFELNREDINIISKELENIFHTDRPGFMETKKGNVNKLKSNWRVLYEGLYPQIKKLPNGSKYTASSLINFYMLISLLTDTRSHSEADKVLGKNVRYKINNVLAFGDWFIKSEAARLDDEWLKDKDGKFVKGDMVNKDGKIIKVKMKNNLGYFAATTRYSALEDIKLRMRWMLRDFKEKISTDALFETVVTKIDTRAVTSKIRKKVALNSGYTIDGAPVTYGTMLDGSEVHIDHVHARSKGGLNEEDNLLPKWAGDNLTKSDMNV